MTRFSRAAAIDLHMKNAATLPNMFSTMHLYPIKRRRVSGCERRYCLELPGCNVGTSNRGIGPGSSEQGQDRQPGPELLKRPSSALRGWRIREHDDGRGGRAGYGKLPRQLRTSGRHQEEVRSRQFLPPEPKHPAGCGVGSRNTAPMASRAPCRTALYFRAAGGPRRFPTKSTRDRLPASGHPGKQTSRPDVILPRSPCMSRAKTAAC